MLALALRAYEDGIDPSTGQRIDLATNPLLADYWTTMNPVRDYAATALAVAQDAVKDDRHPHALRHVLGLREGWEDALTAPQSTPDE